MSNPSAAAPDEPFAASPAPLSHTRPFYWSVRRELWEHRAIYVAPLAAGAIALLGFLISTLHLPHEVRTANPKDVHALMNPFAFAAFAIQLIGLVVAVFYSAGALHGERRDRSILFWKSLPVSDLVVVLSKATTALVVLPAVVLAVIIGANLVMLALATVIVLLNGIDPRMLWSHLTLGFMWLALARGMLIMALWQAPLCAWLVLVSAWARRMPILWAAAPPLAIFAIERLALGKQGALSVLLNHRLIGGFAQAYTVQGQGKVYLAHMADLDLGWFLANPGLWIGLAMAAAFLAGAVWLRRSAEPI